MKRLLRLIFKIIATPLAIPAILLLIAIAYTRIFVAWLYDDTDVNVISREIKDDLVKTLKRWFTQV